MKRILSTFQLLIAIVAFSIFNIQCTYAQSSDQVDSTISNIKYEDDLFPLMNVSDEDISTPQDYWSQNLKVDTGLAFLLAHNLVSMSDYEQDTSIQIDHKQYYVAVKFPHRKVVVLNSQHQKMATLKFKKNKYKIWDQHNKYVAHALDVNNNETAYLRRRTYLERNLSWMVPVGIATGVGAGLTIVLIAVGGSM